MEECVDKLYFYFFDMQKMDIVGFRRLRTSSQLTFESLPQIILQLYILNYLRNNEAERVELDVSLEAIMFSISLAVLHTGIELVFIYLEKVANKTDFMHYTIICFNGRFGFVPFTNHFSNRDASEDVVDYFNYDNISSNLCCLKFQLDYTFSNDTV
jgi:hypothetical protein